MPQSRTICAGDLGGLADVASGAGVDVAAEHLLGDAAAEQHA